MNVTTLVVAWVVLGVATLALALYRLATAKGESDLIHLGPGEEREIPQQVALANRLNAIDRWGKILTVVTLVSGLCLGAMFLYIAWNDPSAVPNTFYRR